MKVRAVSCHTGLASPSVDGTPTAAADAFETPGPVSRLSESHPYASVASAHSTVILSIGFITHLLLVDGPHVNPPVRSG